MDYLETIGSQLRTARKRRFPNDDLKSFALRIGVSRATLQKMEKGDMSVGLGKYFAAARVLGLEANFDGLFRMKESLFDD
ncbi:MAG: helix-turn-helix transcriptional regulator [Candidatus Sedimenticola sp. PURPLELP]